MQNQRDSVLKVYSCSQAACMFVKACANILSGACSFQNYPSSTACVLTFHINHQTASKIPLSRYPNTSRGSSYRERLRQPSFSQDGAQPYFRKCCQLSPQQQGEKPRATRSPCDLPFGSCPAGLHQWECHPLKETCRADRFSPHLPSKQPSWVGNMARGCL